MDTFSQHATMVLQTARAAVESRDPEKLRGAKEVCAAFVEAYTDVAAAAPAGDAKARAAAQLGELRQALRDLIVAERGRFEVGVLDAGSEAADNILPEYRPKKKGGGEGSGKGKGVT